MVLKLYMNFSNDSERKYFAPVRVKNNLNRQLIKPDQTPNHDKYKNRNLRSNYLRMNMGANGGGGCGCGK